MGQVDVVPMVHEYIYILASLSGIKRINGADLTQTIALGVEFAGQTRSRFPHFARLLEC